MVPVGGAARAVQRGPVTRARAGSIAAMGEREAHRVLVVGGGFGGLQAAKHLRHAPADLTLSTGATSTLPAAALPGGHGRPLARRDRLAAAGRAAAPHERATVLLAEVEDIDLERPAGHAREAAGAAWPYDTLIVATGAAPFLLRPRRVGAARAGPQDAGGRAGACAGASSRASRPPSASPTRTLQRAWLTFVVVGGGPTGVELAGPDRARSPATRVRHDFRHIDPTRARIILVEGADRVLTAFPPSLSEKAKRQLEKLGVTVRTDRLVTGVDAAGRDRAGDRAATGAPPRPHDHLGGRRLGVAARRHPGAGVRRPPRPGRPGHRGAGPTLPGHPEVFVLGDMVRVSDGHGGQIPLPGVAPAAMQQGRYAAEVVQPPAGRAAAPAALPLR